MKQILRSQIKMDGKQYMLLQPGDMLVQFDDNVLVTISWLMALIVKTLQENYKPYHCNRITSLI
jgi:hypothetical protein